MTRFAPAALLHRVALTLQTGAPCPQVLLLARALLGGCLLRLGLLLLCLLLLRHGLTSARSSRSDSRWSMPEHRTPDM